jgi:hypothetical protein
MKGDGRAQGCVDGRRDQLDRLSVAGDANLLRLRGARRGLGWRVAGALDRRRPPLSGCAGTARQPDPR